MSDAQTPEASSPTQQSEPTYGNLGEVRAHLLPSKAGRVRTPGSLSGANLQPPPLPRKALTRTQSLPTGATPGRSSSRAGHAQRPLLGARSVDESQAEAGPVVRTPVELTSSVAELALGLHLKDLHSPVAVHAALTAQQLHGLRGIHTQLRARLTGGRPGPCSPSHSFRLLDTSPCLESGDACYYRVVRVLGDAWHVVAAKVPKPGAEAAHSRGLELQALLSPHFNLQGLCGLLPAGTLPAAPWTGSVALVAEVPEDTATRWLQEVGARQPQELARSVALLLLQLTAALECLEARGAVLAELRPENLLLAAPRGCAPAGPPRLLLADFGRVHQLPPTPPGAHAPQLGRLLCDLLSPTLSPASPLARGLQDLAARLPRVRPSAARTRGALQTLLWGPGLELRGPGVLLGPWLQVRRAWMLVQLAEMAACGQGPDLQDWLCCEYLAEATEESLAQALELLVD
ncbi:protein PEAK3 [Ochotona curzoniae]|uniref:protein PEAK3 n=1 Tax=Ochotona curzoniae TaxID=130825 RepID=UPI001B3518A9|nr:protein PEAK3 [Ochotona curzoniae]